VERTVLASFIALGLVLAGIVALAPRASAQDAGALIIGVADCPDGYDGEDYAADCASPASGIEFTIGTPHTDNIEMTTSRGDGLATFSLAPYDLNPAAPDRVSVGEPATQTSDYAVFCTKNGEDFDYRYETIPFEPGGPLLGISFDFETGDQIACEWYRIRRPMPDQGDDSGPVSQLPTTGAGNTTDGNTDRTIHLAQLMGLLVLIGGAAYDLRHQGSR
jgi:hypothetical protein